jgi:hypothetical protein
VKTCKSAIVVTLSLFALALFVGTGWHSVAAHAASNTGTLVIQNGTNQMHSYDLLYSGSSATCHPAPSIGGQGDTYSFPGGTGVQVQQYLGSNCQGDAAAQTSVTVLANQTITVTMPKNDGNGLPPGSGGG